MYKILAPATLEKAEDTLLPTLPIWVLLPEYFAGRVHLHHKPPVLLEAAGRYIALGTLVFTVPVVFTLGAFGATQTPSSEAGVVFSAASFWAHKCLVPQTLYQHGGRISGKSSRSIEKGDAMEKTNRENWR